MDADGNGFIDAAELKATLTSLGLYHSDKEIDEKICEVDRDENGQLDIEGIKQFAVFQLLDWPALALII
ncbi:unnamed protein product [Protopolystoma xenopodis]|uniref:EF-hand domain-containing protein n=1 Tax=Protopolystoma xenopodis TaxID=117903 RepID=A0A3S5A6Y9_9PLAT|nr:unnamed protein product [Protopolystoma xenopodis]